MAKGLLRLLNRLLSLITGLALVAAVLYSGYALWDNRRIYASAENPLSDMAPGTELAENQGAGEDGTRRTADSAEDASDGDEETELETLFRQLKAINPDIGAWITMPGTAIDYAVVRGTNNIEYISKDVRGNFAIVGSIFLDSRNQEDYSDIYNVLYGHNMTEHRMFSDVNLYKDEEFFKENQTGTIYFPTGSHTLQSVSVIVTNASNSWLFNPLAWQNQTPEKILELTQMDAVFVSETGMEALQAKFEAGEAPQFVALTTCSNEFTDARTILLTLLDP